MLTEKGQDARRADQHDLRTRDRRKRNEYQRNLDRDCGGIPGHSAVRGKTDATFREMGLDSLDVAELLLKVEDELHVVLEPSPEHDTIDKLVRFLEQNRK